jgi:hypothetical protein
MSWHYLPELAAGFLVPASLAGELSAPSSSTPTDETSSLPGSATDASSHSRSGTTSGPSTASPGKDGSTSSQEDSPASHSVPLAASEAPMTRETCGPIPPGSFAKYDHASHSWRTFQLSLLQDTLEPFLETWPRSGTVLNGIVSQRPPSAPLIKGTGYGSWPTPQKSDAFVPMSANAKKAAKFHAGLRKSLFNPESEIPTCHRVVTAFEKTGGELNPDLYSWLMGWPIGWTALKPLGTAKFQSWLQWHFESFDLGSKGCE